MILCVFFTVYQFPYYIVRFKHTQIPISTASRQVFPYYIVRFKRTSVITCSFGTFSFHTTQYDLNTVERQFKTIELFLFPYYIVRFKPEYQQQAGGVKTRFHTTQYDLNKIHMQSDQRQASRFHTTQYDLNNIKYYSLFSCNKFPYYIVRFKRNNRHAL